jgi:sulfonate transport system substrate-binding protein
MLIGHLGIRCLFKDDRPGLPSTVPWSETFNVPSDLKSLGEYPTEVGELAADSAVPVVSRRRILHYGIALGAATIAPAQARDSNELRIGYQKGSGLLGVLKAQGQIEKLLTPSGWRVSWAEFPAGPQLLEALNAESIDFGFTGGPPPIFAQAAAVDLVYAGAEPVAASTEAIIVKQNSPLLGIAALKGRQVAVQKGSSAHYLLLEALDQAGLQYADIRPAYLTPALARAAFESDRVEAWAIWDPYLAGAQVAMDLRVLVDYTNLPETFSFYEASRSFANRAPQQLSLLLDALAVAGAWAAAHPLAVAQLLAPQVGLPVDVVETWQRRVRYGIRPLDAHIINSQQKVADLFFLHQLVPKRIDVAAAVWRRPGG